MNTEAAVYVRDIVKHYEDRKVLDMLSMTVERGTIYGLLGASGCGKTTLLSCIVGRKCIESGEIWILGGRPGEKGSGVPGPRIGYMPQELGLVDEFTVKDAIFYFGRIFNMKDDLICDRFAELATLLELPPANRFLRNCSGGQQRRVSLAASLVHKPELLILDEPTVGIDPVLREKIWNHLMKIVDEEKVSVIITTHYLEETKGAHRIGLLRGGKLLAEASPNKLLALFQAQTLEHVFLILSQRQEEHSSNSDVVDNLDEEQKGNICLEPMSIASSTESFSLPYGSKDELTGFKEKTKTKKKVTSISSLNLNKNHVKALLDKNWKQFYRNVGGVLFLLTFPLVQLWFFANSIGGDPKALNLGIVNDEITSALCNDLELNATANPYDGECGFRNLSCRFLTYLAHPMINMVSYDSLPEAIEEVKHGKIIGTLYIPNNFTNSYEERVKLGSGAQKWITDFGEIQGYMDMSNRQTGVILRYKLHGLFIEFQERLFADCHLSTKLAKVPMQIDLLYGDNDEPYSVYMAPGMMIMIVFLLGSTMTSQIVIKDRNDGVWDRSIVAGVSSLEITLTHFVLQGSVMMIETVEVIVMTFFVIKVSYVGSIWNMLWITYLEGVCGMGYGFWVSALCKNHTQANIFVTGMFLPMIVLCGLMWPIESMPVGLKQFSQCLPSTLAIESMRNIMKKGWTFWDPQVVDGFAIAAAWTALFGVGSVWLVKIKK